MAFPKNLLADHEKLIFDLKPHWVALVPPVLWTIAAVAGLFLGYRGVEEVFDENTNNAKMVVGAVVTIAWYFLAVLPAMRWRWTMFVLTSDRLITRSGIVAKHSREIPLERINDIASSQSLFDRLVGSGDLRVESAGEWGRHAFRDIPRPGTVREEIYRQMDLSADRPATAAVWVDSAVTSVPAQIAELGDLRDRGLLSDAEFEAKKAELLERM